MSLEGRSALLGLEGRTIILRGFFVKFAAWSAKFEVGGDARRAFLVHDGFSQQGQPR